METTFIKINTQVLSSTKLTLEEKVLISIVLSFQNNYQTCTKSNQKLAQELSISEISLKRLIAKLNKLNWFSSEKTSKYNEFGKWNNSKEMKIDVEKLMIYLDLENKEIKEEQIEMRNSLTKAYYSEIEEQQTFKPAKAEVKPIEPKQIEVKLTPEQAEEKIELDSLTITPESIISNSDFNFNIVEEQEKPKQTNIEYSHQLVLNCGKVVDIPIKYNDIYVYCLDRKGTMKKIKSCMSENTVYGYFDEEINKLKEEEEMFNAYSKKYA